MSSAPRNPSGGSGADQPDPWWDAGSRLDPDDPDLLERLGLVVPDDARALEADRRALLARRVPRSRSPRAFAVSVTLVLLVGTVALASALLGVLTPLPRTPTADGYPIAEAPLAPPGSVGGLLPDAGVRRGDTDGIGARELRPAVLFVPPEGACSTCATTLAAFKRQALQYGLSVHAVAPVDAVDDTRELLRDAGSSSTHLLVDSAGALTAAFRGPTATAVLVHADGVVGQILRDPSPTARFEQLLSPLRFPAAAPSLRPGATAY